MRAIINRKYGPAEVLKLEEVAIPAIKDQEILINVKAAAVNSADIRLRKPDPFLVRLLFGLINPNYKTLGSTFAGKIEKVGSKVTKWKIGDEIFGLTKSNTGSYADYLSATEDGPMALKPTNLSFVESAALPFGGHTALDYLRKAQIKPNQEILIYGASGSVGTSAIMLSKHFGAKVTAVCSTKNLELVASLGADEVLDYTKNSLESLNKQFDIVFEAVNKTDLNQVLNLVKPEGILVLVAIMPEQMLGAIWQARKMKKKILVGEVKVSAKDINFLKELAENGELKPAIDRIYSLEEIVAAHQYVEQGHKSGNVVIDLDK